MMPLKEEWLPVSDGHAVAMRYSEGSATQPAILFVHGLFSDSRFFLNARGEGPAIFFLNNGFRIFLADLRGHGRSKWPAGKRRWDWNFDTYALSDIAMAVQRTKQRHPGPLFVFCHSMGGYAALIGLALQPELQEGLAGICLFSCAVNDCTDGSLAKKALIRLSGLISAILGRFPAKALKQGPSDEPKALMAQLARWATRGTFQSSDGARDYWRTLSAVTVPVFSAVGELDRFHASPDRAKKFVDSLGSKDKTLLVCGQSHGFGTDFGHADLVRGSASEREVLPRVCAWMQAHLR